MKLSEIDLTAFPSSDIAAIYDSLNNNRTDYPSTDIVSVFRENVNAFPDRTAVKDEHTSLSYRELDMRSNRIARFILEQQPVPETAVAIYLSKSVHMVESILGILKAGAAYVPINVEHPYDRVRLMLNEANAQLIITEKAFAAAVSKLQWECADLRTLLCIDSDDILLEEEPRNDLMSKEFWEYIGHTAGNDITGGGWIDSYTGNPFSREVMDEYGANVLAKLQPYLDKSKKVLEIGCASGITMYRVAPLVGTYYGTDLSERIIEKNRLICAERQIENIRLSCLEAEQIDQLGESDFDIIIVNSVVQAFSGYNYFRRILHKIIQLCGRDGLIFFGDIMDQDKKEALIKDLESYRQANNSFKTKVDFSGELFLSKRFFDDLRHEYKEIAGVVHSEKTGTIRCELTEFRFDTIIHVDKTYSAGMPAYEKYRRQYDRSYLDIFPVEPCAVSITANQLAYIIFTSGSTGIPKGVMVEHRGVLRAVKGQNYVHVMPEDVWLQTCNVAFDASCFEIFGALLNGNTLCLIPMDILLNVDRLQDYIQANNVSVAAMVAPVFHEHASARPAVFSGLRTVIIGGDTLSPKLVNAVREACPGLKLVNVYGPTENAIASTFFEIDADYNTIPIGRPVSNTEAYIVDEDLQLLPMGMAGELVVSGDGIARGYLHDDVLTKRGFIDNPFGGAKKLYLTGDRARLNTDGHIEFLGRKDQQVKVRGNRIELFEIELELLNIPAVESCVALAIDGNDGVKSICAYLKLAVHIEVNEIRGMLARKLPYYMIPSYFIVLDSFPLNINNKIDKKALPRPETVGIGSAVDHIPPRNTTEQRLADIWKSVLGNNMAGVLNNFFEIGGDSLKLIKAFNKINEIYPGVLQISDLFDSPTIEKQALLIQQAASKAGPGTAEYVAIKF